MTPSSRGEAQQRADAIRVCRSELERLEHEGVLTLSEERRRELERYHGGVRATTAAMAALRSG